MCECVIEFPPIHFQICTKSFGEAMIGVNQINFISGLQMTDIELDARVTALEENGGGGGNNQNSRDKKIIDLCFDVHLCHLIMFGGFLYWFCLPIFQTPSPFMLC